MLFAGDAHWVRVRPLDQNSLEDKHGQEAAARSRL